jgi:hypothetical protein
VPSPPVSPRLGNAGGGFFLYPSYLRDPIFSEPRINLSCATGSIRHTESNRGHVSNCELFGLTLNTINNYKTSTSSLV